MTQQSGLKRGGRTVRVMRARQPQEGLRLPRSLPSGLTCGSLDRIPDNTTDGAHSRTAPFQIMLLHPAVKRFQISSPQSDACTGPPRLSGYVRAVAG